MRFPLPPHIIAATIISCPQLELQKYMQYGSNFANNNRTIGELKEKTLVLIQKWIDEIDEDNNE